MNLAFEAFKYFCEGETEVFVDAAEQKVGVKSNSPVLNVCLGIGLVMSIILVAKITVK